MGWRNWVGPHGSAAGASSLKVGLPACLAGLTAVACFAWLSRPFQIPYDDTYITLEFARNMALTGHLTYDGIHRVAGSTTLLHVMLLSVPARLGLPLETTDVVLGTLFFILLIERTAALALRLTQRWEASLYAALTTALTGYLVFDALSGLETTLFMFLAVTCAGSLIKSYTDGKGYWWPALWLFLTALARPEGIWFGGGLFLCLLVSAARRREAIPNLLKLAGCLVGGLLLVFVTQWMVQGTITPRTALCKVYFFTQFRLPLHVRTMIYTDKMRIIWEPLMLVLLPALWARKARPLWIVILPWIVVGQIMFWLLLPNEVYSYHGRYLHPLMPFLFILAGDGFSVLLHTVGKYRIPRWAVAGFLAAVAGIFYLNLVSLQRGFVNDENGIRNDHIWAVKWLKANAPPGILLATHDIGALRYLGGYNLVDVSGLTDEEAFAHNKFERDQLEYLYARRPDYLVGDIGWLTHFLHYFPALRCCATLVATAQPNSLDWLCLRIYRLNWDKFGDAASDHFATPSRVDERRDPAAPSP